MRSQSMAVTEFLRGKNILVAGGGGFIGGHLVRTLIDMPIRSVRAVDVTPVNQWRQRLANVDEVVADLRDLAVCRDAVADADVVFNLAADMGGMGYIETHKAACMLTVLTSTNLLLAARDADVSRFFYASSACVYNVDAQDDLGARSLKESDAYPAMPEDGYGWEKLFTERMCRHFEEDFGLPVRIARFHNIYGPMGTWVGGREKAPAAVCRKVAQATITGAPEIEVWGNGEQVRSFLYVDDAVEAVLLLTASDFARPVNIGSERGVTINALIDIVEAAAGTTLQRRYLPDAPTGVRARNSDNSLIRDVLGWEPRTSLEEGLAATYEWVLNQVATHREAEPAVAL